MRAPAVVVALPLLVAALALLARRAAGELALIVLPRPTEPMAARVWHNVVNDVIPASQSRAVLDGGLVMGLLVDSRPGEALGWQDFRMSIRPGRGWYSSGMLYVQDRNETAIPMRWLHSNEMLLSICAKMGRGVKAGLVSYGGVVGDLGRPGSKTVVVSVGPRRPSDVVEATALMWWARSRDVNAVIVRQPVEPVAVDACSAVSAEGAGTDAAAAFARRLRPGGSAAAAASAASPLGHPGADVPGVTVEALDCASQLGQPLYPLRAVPHVAVHPLPPLPRALLPPSGPAGGAPPGWELWCLGGGGGGGGGPARAAGTARRCPALTGTVAVLVGETAGPGGRPVAACSLAPAPQRSARPNSAAQSFTTVGAECFDLGSLPPAAPGRPADGPPTGAVASLRASLLATPRRGGASRLALASSPRRTVGPAAAVDAVTAAADVSSWALGTRALGHTPPHGTERPVRGLYRAWLEGGLPWAELPLPMAREGPRGPVRLCVDVDEPRLGRPESARLCPPDADVAGPGGALPRRVLLSSSTPERILAASGMAAGADVVGVSALPAADVVVDGSALEALRVVLLAAGVPRGAMRGFAGAGGGVGAVDVSSLGDEIADASGTEAGAAGAAAAVAVAGPSWSSPSRRPIWRRVAGLAARERRASLHARAAASATAPADDATAGRWLQALARAGAAATATGEAGAVSAAEPAGRERTITLPARAPGRGGSRGVTAGADAVTGADVIRAALLSAGRGGRALLLDETPRSGGEAAAVPAAAGGAATAEPAWGSLPASVSTRVGSDPGRGPGLRMTSDEFFADPREAGSRFAAVAVLPGAGPWQALRSAENALTRLAPGGVVVVLGACGAAVGGEGRRGAWRVAASLAARPGLTVSSAGADCIVSRSPGAGATPPGGSAVAGPTLPRLPLPSSRLAGGFLAAERLAGESPAERRVRAAATRRSVGVPARGGAGVSQSHESLVPPPDGLGRTACDSRDERRAAEGPAGLGDASTPHADHRMHSRGASARALAAAPPGVAAARLAHPVVRCVRSRLGQAWDPPADDAAGWGNGERLLTAEQWVEVTGSLVRALPDAGAVSALLGDAL